MISIIIPTLNRANLLELAIKSFCEQGFPPEKFEILVVDNGSTDQTKDVAEKAIALFPCHQIRYICESEPGLLSGRHRGASEAKGEILTFVDDDIEAAPYWLEAIYSTFNDPTVQLVGGRNLPKYEVAPPKWLDWFWSDHPYGRVYGSLSLLDFGEQVRVIDANYVWGLNFSIRKSAIFELGGFHPDCIPKHLQYLQGDGESGLTQKANVRGFKTLYQPQALVYHHVSKERMTHSYFDQRYFYQGVCDSYTQIRASEEPLNRASLIDQIKSPWRDLKQKIQTFTQRTLPVDPHSAEKNVLLQRFQQSYQQGYQFHQNAVRQCPELRAWILKSDYWDYKLPRLKVNHD